MPKLGEDKRMPCRWRASTRHTRDQVLLLPASVEDRVAADSPARFIDAFVDDFDLG